MFRHFIMNSYLECHLLVKTTAGKVDLCCSPKIIQCNWLCQSFHWNYHDSCNFDTSMQGSYWTL